MRILKQIIKSIIDFVLFNVVVFAAAIVGVVAMFFASLKCTVRNIANAHYTVEQRAQIKADRHKHILKVLEDLQKGLEQCKAQLI